MWSFRVPLDFSSGAVWGFWFGIVVALAGVGIALASYIADAQTNERIEAVKESARVRIEELEKKTAERHLTDEQKAAFKELFDGSDVGVKIKMFVVAGQGSGDVSRLMKEIKAVAADAHAQLPPFDPMMNGIMPPGISLLIAHGDDEMVNRADRFGRRIGQRVIWNVSGDPKGTIGIAIGSRAEGFP